MSADRVMLACLLQVVRLLVQLVKHVVGRSDGVSAPPTIHLCTGLPRHLHLCLVLQQIARTLLLDVW